MYAIIRDRGQQYRVEAGQILDVAQLELDPGAEVVLDEVLMIGGENVQVGAPLVPNAQVRAEVVSEARGEKIIVFKKKRRKNHTKRTHGHRQDVVEVRIDSINV